MELLKKTKGFTLIEIIVVLVILAILAAVSIPSYIGFVEEAKGKAFVMEARVGYIAAQAVATEMYAKTNVVPSGAEIAGSETFKNMTAGLTADLTNKFDGFRNPVLNKDGKVIELDYIVTVGTTVYHIILQDGKAATVIKNKGKPV